MTTRRTGQPPKLLEPARRARLLDQIRAAVPIGRAVEAAQIDAATLHRTLARADLAGPRVDEYRQFRDDYLSARAEAEASLVQALVQVALPHTETVVRTKDTPDGLEVETTVREGVVDVKSATWLLERSFGYVRRLEVTGAGGGPLLDPEMLISGAVRRALARSQSEARAEAIEVVSTEPKEQA